MRRLKVEAEISATSYKALTAKLKKFNKNQLWKIFDHYIVHALEEKHAKELLQILESFENSPNPSITAETDDDELESYVPEGKFRPTFAATITDEDLQRSAHFLDLLYDDVYFTYLEPEVRRDNAKKLIAFALSKGLPVQPHWETIAGDEDR